MFSNIVRNHPVAACIIGFVFVMTTFMLLWRWFIYQHDASLIEWLAALALMFAAGAWLDRRSKRAPPQ
jgi:hypothetical protein